MPRDACFTNAKQILRFKQVNNVSGKRVPFLNLPTSEPSSTNESCRQTVTVFKPTDILCTSFLEERIFVNLTLVLTPQWVAVKRGGGQQV